MKKGVRYRENKDGSFLLQKRKLLLITTNVKMDLRYSKYEEGEVLRLLMQKRRWAGFRYFKREDLFS